MPALQVRVEPARAPDLDLDAVADLFQEAATLADAELTLGQEGDEGAFAIVFDFLTLDAPRLWELLQSHVLEHPEIGEDLARASIATYSLRRGLAAGRTLHHYDRRVPIERL